MTYYKTLTFKLLTAIIIVITTSKLQAQVPILIDTADTKAIELFSQQYQTKSEHFLQEIKSTAAKKTYKSFNAQYELYVEDFEEKIKDGDFLYDNRTSKLLNDLYLKLKSNNDFGNKDITLSVSKDRSLNAYMTPDDVLVINIGSIYFIPNEGQMTALLAHEMSHSILEHGRKQWLERIEKDNSRELNAKIDRIRRKKYKRGGAFFDLIKNNIYEEKSKSRQHEFEADSLAILLMKNANVPIGDYMEMMKLSIKYDSITPSGVEPDVYRKYFDLEGQAFKDEWLKQEDYSSYIYNTKIKGLDQDSIASHPDFKDRIASLKRIYPELDKDSLNRSENTDSYDALRTLAEYELLPNLYDTENYGIGVYMAIKMLEKGCDEAYCKQWLGTFFTEMYEAKKKYKLNKYLQAIVPDKHTASYIQFLSLMWNLKLDEMKYIADFYSPTNQ